MTQTGADRLVVGIASVIGFVAGGIAGAVAREYVDVRRQSGDLIVTGGAALGAAIGAMIATPPAEKDLPPRTGVSGALREPRFL